MNLLKRLRNIWRLGELDVPTDYKLWSEYQNKISGNLKQPPLEKPHMAQIIKRVTPAEKFLKNNE